MGRPILPSISKLEDVLDLITDPEKYRKYLIEFKVSYDSVKNAVGDLDTKEKADKYLYDAQAQAKEAAQILKSADEHYDAVIKDAQIEAGNIKATAKDYLKSAEVKLQSLDTTQKLLSDFEKVLNERELVLNVKQSELDAQATNQANVRKALDAELNAMQTRKAKLEDALK